jgi:hypothetical protein
VLCVLLPAWVVSLQTRILRDVRVNTQALQRRELADKEEASRLVDLRIDFLRALEESANATAASIGELEDRMERANLLPGPTTRLVPCARRLQPGPGRAEQQRKRTLPTVSSPTRDILKAQQSHPESVSIVRRVSGPADSGGPGAS